jgi:pimeloyl-ACP methyl ester carboxylesterase
LRESAGISRSCCDITAFPDSPDHAEDPRIKEKDLTITPKYMNMKCPPVQYVNANGITIAYQDFGSLKIPFILINGFASTMDMWNPPFLETLTRHFRVIVFDNRGTGFTSSTGAPFSIPLFAQDTVALMDNLGIDSAHILGLSMGAAIAQELVLTCPDRVNRLVLVSGSCGGDRAVMMQSDVLERLSDKSGTGMEVAERMFSVLFPGPWRESHDPWQYCPEVHETTDAEIAARQSEALYRWTGSFDRLPEIRCPVLVVTGSDDVVIPSENARILADRIPGARLAILPGAGHGLQYQSPEELDEVVVAFLTAR